MASLQSASAAAPAPSAHTGYDPEIKDIADYVHNKAVDSDLAVRPHSIFYPAPQTASQLTWAPTV